MNFSWKAHSSPCTSLHSQGTDDGGSTSRSKQLSVCERARLRKREWVASVWVTSNWKAPVESGNCMQTGERKYRISWEGWLTFLVCFGCWMKLLAGAPHTHCCFRSHSMCVDGKRLVWMLHYHWKQVPAGWWHFFYLYWSLVEMRLVRENGKCSV